MSVEKCSILVLSVSQENSCSPIYGTSYVIKESKEKEVKGQNYLADKVFPLGILEELYTAQ